MVSSKKNLASYEQYLGERLSLGTARLYMYYLRRWLKHLDGTPPTKDSAQLYIDKLAKDGKSPNTISVCACAIIRWFRYRDQTIALDCPTVRYNEPEYLTLDQVEKLLSACNTILEETLITVLFDTAIRISELLGLELDDINWNGRFITVLRKGGWRQEVNISEKALSTLREWLDARRSNSKRVFMDLAYYDAWLTLRAVGKRVGLKVHPHTLRHSRAVHMMMNGADMHVVKEHLGHTNISVTFNIYGRFKAVHLKELVPAW